MGLQSRSQSGTDLQLEALSGETASHRAQMNAEGGHGVPGEGGGRGPKL